MGMAKAQPVACLIVGSGSFRCLPSVLFSSFKWCRLQGKSQGHWTQLRRRENSLCYQRWRSSARVRGRGKPSFPLLTLCCAQCGSRLLPGEPRKATLIYIRHDWSTNVMRHMEERRLGTGRVTEEEEGKVRESLQEQKGKEIGVTQEL